MQSFSILHWMIFAIVIGLVAGAVVLLARAIQNRRPRERRAVTPGDGPSGFQGWLLLLAIGVFVSPLLTIVLMLQSQEGIDDATLQKFRLTFNGEIGLFLAWIALQICTAFFMARRSRRFVSLYIGTAIATILFKPIDLVWAASMLSFQAQVAFQPLFQQILAQQNISQWISTFIGLVIWIIYVIRSRRVANTFVR